MPLGSRALRAGFFASATLAMVSSARGDAAQDRTHATIRGTGNNVTIVYGSGNQGPSRHVMQSPAGASVLAEAVRLKTQGEDDATVMDYLRVHRADLPPVAGTEVVRQLRKAGAGESLISDLSTLTALDIGETGEARSVDVATETEGAAAIDMGYDVAQAGYPLGVGYGAQGAQRFGRHRSLPPNRFVFHRVPPPFHRHLGMHAPPAHRPVPR